MNGRPDGPLRAMHSLTLGCASFLGFVPINALVFSDLATIQVVGSPGPIQKRASKRSLVMSANGTSGPGRFRLQAISSMHSQPRRTNGIANKNLARRTGKGSQLRAVLSWPGKTLEAMHSLCG